MRTCMTCFHYRAARVHTDIFTGEVRGECHYNAPVFRSRIAANAAFDPLEGIWPTVAETNSCGRWTEIDK